MHPTARILRLAAGLSFALVVVACGGGGGGGDEAPAAPPVVVVPVGPMAAFASATTATANGAIAFDAGASTSSDGSALQYRWDFGDGQHGGGKSIAHAFANAGAPVVTLTVIDGAARQNTATRTVTVAAGPAPSGSVSVHAFVKDLDGVAVAGVAITAGSVTATTDAMGRADIALGKDVPLALKLVKAGYADQWLAVQLPAGAGTDTLVDATMRPRDAALTLADAHTGGTVTGRVGASLTLPADALVNGAGSLVTGAVQVSLTPVDVTSPGAGGFPGRFDGVRADASTTPIVSFGTVEFVLSSGSERLQLAAGKTATIEVPIWAARRIDGTLLAVGDTTPLWSLDEESAIWVQEGTGTVVAAADSPSGLAMRATVSHFSWWNSDGGFEPYGPQPRCVYDTDSGVPGGLDTFATATVCNMLAEIDRGPGAPRPKAVRALAAPLPPAIAGYSRRAILPAAGGITLPVPANVGIVLNATALNGTWTGRKVVSGAVGVREEVIVPMRPVAGSGPAIEPVAVPLDTSRALQTGQTARFSFTGAASQYVRITAGPSTGSTLVGRVALTQGATTLATRDFGPADGVLSFALPTAGTYGIEVSGLANTPGSYRLQVELLGGLQTESVAYPADVTKTLPVFTTYQASVDVAAAGAAHVVLQPTGSPAMQLTVFAPDGSVLAAKSIAARSYEIATLQFPVAAAGRYRVQVASVDGFAVQFRLTAEPTSWLQVGAQLDTDSLFALIDLVPDRNAKPVVGFFLNRNVAGASVQTILLRRWTGTAWESVGSDLPVGAPCTTSNARIARFAFDSTNAPMVVFGKSSADGMTSSTTIVRFAAGAWQGVGPNGGVLPSVGGNQSSCSDTPSLVVDAADKPTVAYKAGNDTLVQRLDGTAWTTLGSLPSLRNSFDLNLDAAGVPWIVLAPGYFEGATVVRKFDATTNAFVTVGANGGALPETNTNGLARPRLRFDAAGKPVIAVVAGVGSGTVSAGIAVYRYDGTVWTTSGGFQYPNSYAGSTEGMGFDISGTEALLSSQSQDRTFGGALVVQRNTAAGYAPVGLGRGEVTQFWGHAITPDLHAIDSRLVVIGSEVYIVAVTTPDAASTPPKVTLLRKVGG